MKKWLGCSGFVDDQRGVTAVEFALVAPVLFLFIFGIIEFSQIMFTKSVMEGSTNITSRLGKTGYVESGKSREDMLRALLVERTSGILDPEKIEIQTLVYDSFKDIGKAEPFTDSNGNGQWDIGEAFVDVNGDGVWNSDLGKAGLGGAGDIVVYKVAYNWPIQTPVMNEFLGDVHGNLPLRVSVVVRNEPYEH